MVQWVAELMPPGYEASGQGVIYLWKDGGSVVGVWLGGWLQDSFGPAIMFDTSAYIVAMGAIVLTLLFRFDWAPTCVGGRSVMMYQNTREPQEPQLSIPTEAQLLTEEE